MTNYALLGLILLINIFKKCITCNFSSLTLAHSQAGRRADDKAEEAGVLVFFFHLFFLPFMVAFRFLDLSARSMHSQFLKHGLQLTCLLSTRTFAPSLYTVRPPFLFFFLHAAQARDCPQMAPRVSLKIYTNLTHDIHWIIARLAEWNVLVIRTAVGEYFTACAPHAKTTTRYHLTLIPMYQQCTKVTGHSCHTNARTQSNQAFDNFY